MSYFVDFISRFTRFYLLSLPSNQTSPSSSKALSWFRLVTGVCKVTYVGSRYFFAPVTVSSGLRRVSATSLHIRQSLVTCLNFRRKISGPIGLKNSGCWPGPHDFSGIAAIRVCETCLPVHKNAKQIEEHIGARKKLKRWSECIQIRHRQRLHR